jgi:antitoxin ParD1/3/4
MSTMNISLPDSLKSFVDSRIADGDYGSSSEYLRELIRKDRDRLKLKTLLLDGASSPKSKKNLDRPYFEALRKRAARRRR